MLGDGEGGFGKEGFGEGFVLIAGGRGAISN